MTSQAPNSRREDFGQEDFASTNLAAPCPQNNDRKGVFSTREGKGLRLRKALKKVAADCGGRLELVEPRDWLKAIAYVCLLLDGAVTFSSMKERASEIGYPLELAKHSDVLIVAWEMGAAAEAGAVPSARHIGDLVKLTREQRERLRINNIDAFDEPATERKKRLKTEQKARARAKRGAIPRSQSLKATKPWEAEDISESTWRRRNRAVTEIRGVAESSTYLPTPEKRSNVEETPENQSIKDAA